MNFYDLDGDSEASRVEQLVAKDKDGAKQLAQVSKHSPGPVADDEILARSLDYPNKFVNEGGLNDTLFQDAFLHGASAQRLHGDWNVQAPEVHDRFELRAEARRTGEDGRRADPENLYVGAFHMSAAELRACRLNGDTAARVRVYDAGVESDRLHAEIIVDASGLNKSQRKELRVRLMTLAQQRGLFVSPHLPAKDFVRAERTQCELHLMVVHQAVTSQLDAVSSSNVD